METTLLELSCSENPDAKAVGTILDNVLTQYVVNTATTYRGGTDVRASGLLNVRLVSSHVQVECGSLCHISLHTSIASTM